MFLPIIAELVEIDKSNDMILEPQTPASTDEGELCFVSLVAR